MVTAVFENNKTVTSASDLWQWDYGQVLKIEGLNLPAVVEVHFSTQETGGVASVCIGTTKDGVTEVDIPTTALENNETIWNYNIFAFVYLTDENSGKTEYRIKIPVKSRPKPEEYNEPEDTNVFDKVIQEVKASAEKAAESELAAKASEEAAKEAREGAEEAEDYVRGVANGIDAHAERLKNEISGVADEEIKQANEAKTELENTINTAEETKTGLQNVVDSAEQVESDIQKAVTRANEAAGDAENAAGNANNSAKLANDAAEAVLAQVNQITFAINADDGGLDITYTPPEETQTVN